MTGRAGWLVVSEPPSTKARVVAIAATPFHIGRRETSELVLADPAASRGHARIDRDGTTWSVSDLGAANGTYVNQARLPAHGAIALQPGDEIRIGATILRFVETPASGPPPVADSGEATRLGSLGASLPPALPPEVVRPADQVALPRSLEYFKVLHDLAKILLGAQAVADIAGAALDLLFGALPVERGAVLLAESGTQELGVVARRTRPGDGEVTVSQTISRWVLRERVAVITSDARHDPRFQEGASIHAFHIRSALCVPLWSESGSEGVIYLDNRFDAHVFTEAELELVTAVANQVAIGIRQARLTEQIRQEAVVRANLARYHSPDVVEMILRQSRDGRSVEIAVAEESLTVLFCDVSGFTALSERLQPSEVAALLNAFFERTTQAIFRHQGSVNKYIGDSVMAIFGAPIAAPNHGEQGVRAALAMQEAVSAMQADLAPDRRFRVRIGVNTGRVVVGNIGSAQRMEFTVLGDAVNVAQRLESVCEPGRILVGGATYQATRDVLAYRDLGEVTLKGKQHAVRAYEVVP